MRQQSIALFAAATLMSSLHAGDSGPTISGLCAADLPGADRHHFGMAIFGNEILRDTQRQLAQDSASSPLAPEVAAKNCGVFAAVFVATVLSLSYALDRGTAWIYRHKQAPLYPQPGVLWWRTTEDVPDYRNKTLFNQLRSHELASIIMRHHELINRREFLCAAVPDMLLGLKGIFSSDARRRWGANWAEARACEKDIEFLCGLSIATKLEQAMDAMRDCGWLEGAAQKPAEATRPEAVDTTQAPAAT